VLPLPVVLISTVSQEGVRNAAPWSNVTPILRPFDEIMIASWIKRDTLNNIRQTGEFVVNVPPAGMEEQVIICSKNYPPEVDERFFNKAGEMDYERAKPLSVMLGDKGMWFTRPVFAGRYAEYAEMFLSKGE